MPQQQHIRARGKSAFRFHGEGADFIYSASTDSNVKRITNGGVEDLNIPQSTSAASVDVDVLGNIYVGLWNGDIKKFNSTGNLIWSSSHHSARVWELIVDNSGFIYTASDDGTCKKVSSDGQSVLWETTGHDKVYSVKLDYLGNVYFGDIHDDIEKYDNNGNLIWKYLDHPDQSGAWGVAVDPFLNVFFATRNGNNDGDLVKLDQTGNHVWTVNIAERCMDCCSDIEGNVIVGTIQGGVHKYDTDGNLLETYNMSGGVYRVMTDLAFNVYAVGGGSKVIKLDTSFNLKWTNTDHNNTVFGVSSYPGKRISSGH